MRLFFAIAVLAAVPASLTDAGTKEPSGAPGPLRPSSRPGASFPGGGSPTGGYFDGSFNARPVGEGPAAGGFVRRPFGGEPGGAPANSIVTGPGGFNGAFPQREAGYLVGGAEGNFGSARSRSGAFIGTENFGPVSESGHGSFILGMGSQGGSPGFGEGLGASHRLPRPSAGFGQHNLGWGSESGNFHSKPGATAGSNGPASEGAPGFPESFSNGPISYQSAPRGGYYPVFFFLYGGPYYYAQRYDAYGYEGLHALNKHDSYGQRQFNGLYRRY